MSQNTVNNRIRDNNITVLKNIFLNIYLKILLIIKLGTFTVLYFIFLNKYLIIPTVHSKIRKKSPIKFHFLE